MKSFIHTWASSSEIVLGYFGGPSHCLCVLPRWQSGRESSCQCMKCGFELWVGKIPQSTKWQPIPVFLPVESHGQKSLQATVHGVKRVRHKWAIEDTQFVHPKNKLYIRDQNLRGGVQNSTQAYALNKGPEPVWSQPRSCGKGARETVRGGLREGLQHPTWLLRTGLSRVLRLPLRWRGFFTQLSVFIFGK